MFLRTERYWYFSMLVFLEFKMAMPDQVSVVQRFSEVFLTSLALVLERIDARGGQSIGSEVFAGLNRVRGVIVRTV